MDNNDFSEMPDHLRRYPADNHKAGDPVDHPEPNNLSSTQTEEVGAEDYQPHPLTNMFPRMQGDEFSALVACIKEDKLEEPIVIHEGQILDGRNRYAACKKAGENRSLTNTKGMIR